MNVGDRVRVIHPRHAKFGKSGVVCQVLTLHEAQQRFVVNKDVVMVVFGNEPPRATYVDTLEVELDGEE